MTTEKVNRTIMAMQQAILPTAPNARPNTAPNPARVASGQGRPPIISNNPAPRNGPMMIPGRLKKRPIRPPTTAPTTPRQVAPSFRAPIMLAR
jgi:hypothetical protein